MLRTWCGDLKRRQVDPELGVAYQLPITNYPTYSAAVEDSVKDTCMLWVASCLCFFGILRMGEAVIPSNSSYDPEVHLSAGDVKVDNRENPSFVEVRIKHPKRMCFEKGRPYIWE